jgi:hypothetical protein
MQGLLQTAASSGLAVAGLVLLIVGATILVRGRVRIGSLPEATGLRARLIGVGATAVGAALWLLRLPV